MQPLMDWGIALILWLQQFRPTFDVPFRAFTFMGDELFFLLFLPLVYWCLDRRTGARVTLLFLVSAYVNAVAKEFFAQPRPVQYDTRVWAYSDVGGSAGLPSGHAQNTLVVWGYLAAKVRRTWMWIVAGILIVCVSLSRLYLGVHFPHDLFGGYIIGALLLFVYLRWGERVEQWLAGLSLGAQLALVAIFSIPLMLLFPSEDGVTGGATLLGMGIGFVAQARWIGFEADGVLWRRAARYALGAAVMLGLWAGLRAAFSALEPALLFRFIRYTLMGFWGGAGAPWVFVRLGLAPGRGQRQAA
ncbi:MAG TPA: phosphatase PAP2 family protein [Anaerolineae bacterium]|nr:phosphatase PAP2 family protein [Anaerolineae bacterium]HQI86643.1 phosphatase PAP2 family protein [Anaerolineae bacterium]